MEQSVKRAKEGREGRQKRMKKEKEKLGEEKLWVWWSSWVSILRRRSFLPPCPQDGRCKATR
jgi:hypothetical protein